MLKMFAEQGRGDLFLRAKTRSPLLGQVHLDQTAVPVPTLRLSQQLQLLLGAYAKMREDDGSLQVGNGPLKVVKN